MQELLRFLPAFLAGVVYPLIPLLLLFLLPTEAPARRRWLLAILFWLLAYATLTWLCLERI